MHDSGTTIGWKLDRREREALLVQIPPLWPDIVADHVTLAAGVPPGTPLPEETRGEIVGSVSDGEGLQAVVVRIGGSVDRPDGGIYHVTWSLDRGRGREAVESNAVLARLGWVPFYAPVKVHLLPARL